ncbi:MAG: hypothetical protein AAFX98_08235, partial [Pseudomonadota bacterium]
MKSGLVGNNDDPTNAYQGIAFTPQHQQGTDKLGALGQTWIGNEQAQTRRFRFARLGNIRLREHIT